MATRLCSMMAADQYMGDHASPQAQIVLPTFDQSQMATLGPMITQGQLDKIAVQIMNRLAEAKATTLGVFATQQAVERWIVEQKKWWSVNDMYKEYGKYLAPGGWEQWVQNTVAAGVAAWNNDYPTTQNSGTMIQNMFNTMADAWWKDLIYPICIEQAVDQFWGYASTFKP
jgi:hypothetical protein